MEPKTEDAEDRGEKTDRAVPLLWGTPPPGVVFVTEEPPCELCEEHTGRCWEHAEPW